MMRWFVLALCILGAPVQAMGLLPGGGAVPASVAPLPTFKLTTAVAGTNTLPFTVGELLPDGAACSTLTTNATSSQVIIQKTWNSGCAKHVIISGTQSLTQNVATTISVQAGSGSGTALTCAGDMVTANPTITVNLGTAGSVSLSSVISSPIRTWVSGPEMVDCHYKATASSGLLVLFYVRLYKSGNVYARVAVENGWVDQDLGNLTYSPTVTIGSTVVYNPGSITHYHYTAWTVTGWTGTDPQIIPTPDTAYMVSTKLIPNYFMDTPTATRLNSLYQTYTYDTIGDGEAYEPNTAAQFQIGLLPGWEALYITSLGDSRAYKALLANASQEYSFPIVFRGHADNDLMVRPSQFPTTNCPGSSGGSNDGCGFSTPTSSTALTWDVCHSSGGGYVAYIVSGEYFFAELLQAKAATAYLGDGSGLGSGTSRSVFHTAVRCPTWEMRTMALEAAIMPTSDAVTADIQTRLATAASISATQVSASGQNNLGILYEYDLFQGGPPHCHGSAGFEATCSLFMEFFMAQVFGFVSDIEPMSAANLVNWNIARDYMAKIPVNLLGSLSGTDFCYSWAAGTFDYTYNATQDLSSVTDPNFAANFGAVYNLTQLTTGQFCTNTLQGSSGSDPANGATTYWANLLPAVSLAVDHGTTGMQAGLNRLTGASNYSSFRNATGSNSFADSPQFGIQPRGQHI